MAAITGLLKNVRQRNSQRHIALGLQFSPRLRDLADQTLYRIDKSIRYQHISPLVRGAIQPRLFLTHWDDLLRTAGSLKLGWVTASLFIAKLQSSRRKNVLTRALQEYGRLNKTIFILRYLLSEQVQRRIGTQINKGEALHAFRGFLFLPNEGKIRRRYHEEQLNQASCLIGNQPSQDFSQPSTLEELSAILQFPKLALV